MALFSVQLGAGIEMVLLSFALADRINILRSEKNEAQKMTLEQEHITRITLQKSKEELEIRVSERTSELSLQKERAEEATKLKDKFVSLVAHDLRSPLSSIFSMLKLAKGGEGGVDNAQRQNFITRAQDTCETLLDMIQEMLNVQRIQSGKMRVESKQHPLKKLVNYYVAPLSHLAEQKGIVISIDIEDGKEINVDIGLFGQVIQNLVSNSIKFCTEGDKITIVSPANGNSVLSVKDTGSGISDTLMPDLFKQDVKTSKPGTAGEKGNGLGLALCESIVRAHGGSIWVESVEGEGSVFYVDLPEA